MTRAILLLFSISLGFINLSVTTKADIVEFIDITPSGTRYAKGFRNGVIEIYEKGSKYRLHKCDIKEKRIKALSFLDNDQLLISDEHGGLRKYIISTQKTVSINLPSNIGSIYDIVVLPSDNSIFFAGQKKIVGYDLSSVRNDSTTINLRKTRPKSIVEHPKEVTKLGTFNNHIKVIKEQNSYIFFIKNKTGFLEKRIRVANSIEPSMNESNNLISSTEQVVDIFSELPVRLS